MSAFGTKPVLKFYLLTFFGFYVIYGMWGVSSTVVSGYLLIMNLRVKASFVAVEGDPVNHDSECLAERKIPWLVQPVFLYFA